MFNVQDITSAQLSNKSQSLKMMKLVVFSALIAVSMAAAAYSGDPKLAKVLRSDSDISPEGNYHYAYDTENGISGEETGVLKGVGTEAAVVASGAFQWVAPEGDQIQIQYVADENGYQPVGSALPTPPPIPPVIQRALEYIAAHPPTPDSAKSVFG